MLNFKSATDPRRTARLAVMVQLRVAVPTSFPTVGKPFRGRSLDHAHEQDPGRAPLQSPQPRGQGERKDSDAAAHRTRNFRTGWIGRIFSRVPFFDERNTRITCSNGVHTIRLPNAEALEGILAKSGQTLSNGMTPRITKVEVKKSLEEICDFISAELKTQERSANLSRGGNQWQGQPEPRLGSTVGILFP